MDDSSYQLVLVFVILAAFMHALTLAARGFTSATSWFALFFSLNLFSQSLFTFPMAFAGDPNKAWLIGLSESTVLLQAILVSLCAMWAGNWIARWSMSTVVNRLQPPLLSGSPRRLAKYLTIVAYVGPGVVIVAAAFGTYGYFKAGEYAYAPPLWHGLLSAFVAVCLAATFLVVYDTYLKNQRLGMVNWGLVISWVFSGFMAGYKYQVVVPVLIVVVCAWMSRKLKLRHFSATLVILALAYMIVEPMREQATEAGGESDVVELLFEVVQNELLRTAELPQIVEKLTARLDVSETAVLALEADQRGILYEYKDALQRQYVLLPALMVVPRALWPEKPLADFGRLLSIAISNNPRNSITPSGAIVSYITGGYWFVFVFGVVTGWLLTLSGMLMAKCKKEPMRYAPMILLALSFVGTSEYLSVTLINLGRAVGGVFLLYAFFSMAGMTTRSHVSAALKKRQGDV